MEHLNPNCDARSFLSCESPLKPSCDVLCSVQAVLMQKAPSTAKISQSDDANVKRGCCHFPTEAIIDALHLTADDDNETKFAQNL